MTTSNIRKREFICHCNQYECSDEYTEKFVDLLDEYTYVMEGLIEDEIVDAICAVLTNPKILACGNSLGILMHIELISEIEHFSTAGKKKIRDMFVLLYPKIAESDAVEARCMTLIEYIVEHGIEDDSIEILTEFIECCTGCPKAILPYGFYCLYKQTQSPSIKEICLDRLYSLLAEEDQDVAAEARLHLLKLGKLRNIPPKI